MNDIDYNLYLQSITVLKKKTYHHFTTQKLHISITSFIASPLLTFLTVFYFATDLYVVFQRPLAWGPSAVNTTGNFNKPSLLLLGGLSYFHYEI
jgi:hypothetical protein